MMPAKTIEAGSKQDDSAAQAVVAAARQTSLDVLRKALPVLPVEAAEQGWAVGLESSKDVRGVRAEALFSIFKSNMKDLYRLSSWGWHPAKKKEELADSRMLHVILAAKPGSPVIGFASFMFDVENEQPVVYLYEVQLTKAQRNKGYGKFLLTCVEAAGAAAGLDKVMLTCFHKNTTATTFFKQHGYTIDEYSPEDQDGVDYSILSKSGLRLLSGDADQQKASAGSTSAATA